MHHWQVTLVATAVAIPPIQLAGTVVGYVPAPVADAHDVGAAAGVLPIATVPHQNPLIAIVHVTDVTNDGEVPYKTVP